MIRIRGELGSAFGQQLAAILKALLQLSVDLLQVCALVVLIVGLHLASRVVWRTKLVGSSQVPQLIAFQIAKLTAAASRSQREMITRPGEKAAFCDRSLGPFAHQCGEPLLAA